MKCTDQFKIQMEGCSFYYSIIFYKVFNRKSVSYFFCKDIKDIVKIVKFIFPVHTYFKLDVKYFIFYSEASNRAVYKIHPIVKVTKLLWFSFGNSSFIALIIIPPERKAKTVDNAG